MPYFPSSGLKSFNTELVFLPRFVRHMEGICGLVSFPGSCMYVQVHSQYFGNFMQKTCVVRCSLCVKCWIVCCKHTSHLSRSVFYTHHSIPQYITVYHSISQYITVYCSISPYTTVYHSILQYITVSLWVYLCILISLETAHARRQATLIKTSVAFLWLIQGRYGWQVCVVR